MLEGPKGRAILADRLNGQRGHRQELTMRSDNASIARATYEAYVRKDRGKIEALLAEDFHFTSPLDNRLDRKTYFERCWPNSAKTTGFDFIHCVAFGDRVFVTYEGRNSDGHRYRNTEILTIQNEQVVDVEVYFGWSLPHPATAGSFIDANKT